MYVGGDETTVVTLGNIYSLSRYNEIYTHSNLCVLVFQYSYQL